MQSSKRTRARGSVILFDLEAKKYNVFTLDDRKAERVNSDIAETVHAIAKNCFRARAHGAACPISPGVRVYAAHMAICMRARPDSPR